MAPKPYGTDSELSGASTSTIVLAAASTPNLPLNTSYQNPYERHDANAPSIYVPQPQRAPFRPSMEAPTHRPQGQGYGMGGGSPQQYPMTERYSSPYIPPSGPPPASQRPPQSQQQQQQSSRVASPPRDPFVNQNAGGRYASPPGPPPGQHTAYSTPFAAPSSTPITPATSIPKLAPPPSSQSAIAGLYTAEPTDAASYSSAYTQSHSREPSGELTNPFESPNYQVSGNSPNMGQQQQQTGAGYPPPAGPPPSY